MNTLINQFVLSCNFNNPVTLAKHQIKNPEDDADVSKHVEGTLVNDQLDAQFLYFIIRLLQSSTCYEQRRALNQEVRLY